MKKVSGRAIFPLILAIVLLAGTVLLCVRYFAKADEWVTFSGSPHVYTGVNLDGGVVTDRDGTLLLDSTDGGTIPPMPRRARRRCTCWATGMATFRHRCSAALRTT